MTPYCNAKPSPNQYFALSLILHSTSSDNYVSRLFDRVKFLEDDFKFHLNKSEVLAIRLTWDAFTKGKFIRFHSSASIIVKYNCEIKVLWLA